jgi:hypothetical protein
MECVMRQMEIAYVILVLSFLATTVYQTFLASRVTLFVSPILLATARGRATVPTEHACVQRTLMAPPVTSAISTPMDRIALRIVIRQRHVTAMAHATVQDNVRVRMDSKVLPVTSVYPTCSVPLVTSIVLPV